MTHATLQVRPAVWAEQRGQTQAQGTDAREVAARGSRGEKTKKRGRRAGALEQETTEDTLYISGGIVEVQPDQVIILADVMEQAKDLNEAAAENAKSDKMFV